MKKEHFKASIIAGAAALVGGYLLVFLIAIIGWRFGFWIPVDAYYLLGPMLILSILYLAGAVVVCTVLLLKCIASIDHKLQQKNNGSTDRPDH